MNSSTVAGTEGEIAAEVTLNFEHKTHCFMFVYLQAFGGKS